MTRLHARAGDKAEHLLWRLENGELPSGKRHPKIVAVMIGTNGTATLEPLSDHICTGTG